MTNKEGDANSRIRILCLNGGGVRGLFTISVLAEVERIIESKKEIENVKIGNYFDLITGTSIGGILALGLAKGKSARELKEKFYKQAPLIFPQRLTLINTLKSLILPRYSNKPLKFAVEEMLGKDTTFNELERRALIPAVNLSDGEPQFFKTPHNPQFTRDGDLKIVDAAMATSAAPTYFPPYYCKDLNAYFADGGLVANNPSYISLLEVFRDMKYDFPNASHKNTQFLNIGTLGEKYTIRPKTLSSSWKKGYIGLWGVGENLVLSTMSANQILHKHMLKRELSNHSAQENFIVIDDSIPNEAASDITLDNANESSLENLVSRGCKLANTEYAKNENFRAFFNNEAKTFNKLPLRKQ